MNCARNLFVLLAVVMACYQPQSGRAADAADERIAAAIRTAQSRQDGDSADALNFLGEQVVAAAADPAERAGMETLIIQGLAGAQTRAGRDFFCRQLVMIGSEAAVPELAKLLTVPESSHVARYALARIPGAAADAALLEALGKADDQLKVGIVNSLGARNCREAVERIAALVSSPNEELAAASLVALGRIDSETAVAALAKARGGVPAKLKPVATDAYLDCAARMLKQGKVEAALAIYRQLYAAGEPSMCRVAALNGLIAAQKDQAIALVIAALGDNDPQVRRVAVPSLRNVPGASATQAIVAELSRQGEEVQAQLLGVLADRGDPAALPAVVKASDAASSTVRVAALNSLAVLGNASVASLLAQRAAEAPEPAEQQAARNSLNLLRADGTNAAIARLLSADHAGVRAEAAKSLAARSAADQVAALLNAAEDQEPAVAGEIFKAIRVIAKAEHVPALVRLLTSTQDAGVRGEAENAVVAAAATTAAGKNAAEPVLAALSGAGSAQVRASLLRVLGRIAHASALPDLYRSAQDTDAGVKDAAIRALAEWPTGEPATVLLGIASNASASQVHRVLALRGYVAMITKQPEATDDQILDSYARAMQLAGRNEDKQLVLSKLGLFRHRRALEMARQWAADPALKPSAEAAAQNIEKLLAAPARVAASHSPDKANQAIDKDPNTRWDTGGAQQGGEWFRIELDEDCLIKGLVLDSSGSGGDYPRGYEIYVSPSSLGDGQLVVKGQGNAAVTKIVFPQPVRGRAIKIVQTGRAEGLFWSIHELTVDSQPVGN
jgi:HEAT repeat protein